MTRFLFSLSLILGGISLGYAIQRVAQRRLAAGSLDNARAMLQKVVMLGLTAPISISAIWIVRIPNRSLWLLPLLDVFGILIGGGLALLAASAFNMPPKQAGALFTCGAFTNIGSIGGLVAFVFLDERAFALMMIYTLLQPLTYNMIGFPIAKSYGLRGAAQTAATRSLAQLMRDPFILIPFFSACVGGVLNLSGLPRPAALGTLNAFMIPGTTFLLLVSIGMALRFSRVKAHLRECAVIAGIKFVCVPLCVSLCALWLGYRAIDGGLPMKVILIVSSMPVAFNALIASSIYHLDLDVANSCFLFTTGGLLVTLPTLSALMHLI